MYQIHGAFTASHWLTGRLYCIMNPEQTEYQGNMYKFCVILTTNYVTEQGKEASTSGNHVLV